MDRSDLFWQTYLSLEREVIEASKYIFFTDVRIIQDGNKFKEEPCPAQLETFSPHLCDLLINCCVQIEAISKELYFANGGEKERGDTGILFDAD